MPRFANLLTRPTLRYLFSPSQPTDCVAIVYPVPPLTRLLGSRLPETRPFAQVARRDAMFEGPF